MADDPRQRREEGRKPCFAACITKPGHAGASLRTARHTLRPRRGTQHAALRLSKTSRLLKSWIWRAGEQQTKPQRSEFESIMRVDGIRQPARLVHGVLKMT